jgi:hypothetical protein
MRRIEYIQQSILIAGVEVKDRACDRTLRRSQSRLDHSPLPGPAEGSAHTEPHIAVAQMVEYRSSGAALVVVRLDLEAT